MTDKRERRDTNSWDGKFPEGKDTTTFVTPDIERRFPKPAPQPKSAG